MAPDSLSFYRTPDENVMIGKRVAFADRWDDECDRLDRLQMDALGLLSTLDAMREEMIWAHEIEEVDFFAADFAGSLHDLISNRIGRAQKEADEIGLNPDEIDNDMSVFAEQVDIWLARAKARRAEKVYMTAADLGLSSPAQTKGEGL